MTTDIKKKTTALAQALQNNWFFEVHLGKSGGVVPPNHVKNFVS